MNRVDADKRELNRITDTSRQEVRPDWLFGGAPRAIEAQEARGQTELVRSQQLPTKMSAADRGKLEAAGVKFLTKDSASRDPLFLDVEFPAGWQKKPTDHSMWSDLVNDKGEKVASIFYKAAFYDRDAFLSIPRESPLFEAKTA